MTGVVERLGNDPVATAPGSDFLCSDQQPYRRYSSFDTVPYRRFDIDSPSDRRVTL